MNYRVIRYSTEHIHIVQKHGRGRSAHLQVQCVMSPNWNRCTARALDLKDYSSITSRDRSYYDGNRWTKAEVSDYCPDCQYCVELKGETR